LLGTFVRLNKRLQAKGDKQQALPWSQCPLPPGWQAHATNLEDGREKVFYHNQFVALVQ